MARRIEATAVKRKLTSSERDELKSLYKRMKELYDQAWEKTIK